MYCKSEKKHYLCTHFPLSTFCRHPRGHLQKRGSQSTRIGSVAQLDRATPFICREPFDRVESLASQPGSSFCAHSSAWILISMSK